MKYIPSIFERLDGLRTSGRTVIDFEIRVILTRNTTAHREYHLQGTFFDMLSFEMHIGGMRAHGRNPHACACQ